MPITSTTPLDVPQTTTPATESMRYAIRVVRTFTNGFHRDRDSVRLRELHTHSSDRLRFRELGEKITSRSSTGYGGISDCIHCDELRWTYSMYNTTDGDYVCQDCFHDGHYLSCARCGDTVPSGDTHEVANYGMVCETCAENYFEWCDDCEAYHNGEDNHAGCGCKPQFPEFTFPANGHGVLAQDERLAIELPAGTISEAGMQQIKYIVRNALYEQDHTCDFHLLASVIDDLDPQWQTKAGNFTKRFSKALWVQHKVKVPPHLISEIGNLAKTHTSSESAFHIEFTRNLNLPARAFANAGSCWWQSYVKSRCMFKDVHGIGLRTFAEASPVVNGRAWVVALAKQQRTTTDYNPRNSDGKRLRDEDGELFLTITRSETVLTPTHDTIGAAAYLVFNGYGDLTAITAARLVGHLTDCPTYKRVAIESGDMYVNGEFGYLVAPQELCDKTTVVEIANEDWHHTAKRSCPR